jgi:hypothetical protein
MENQVTEATQLVFDSVFLSTGMEKYGVTYSIFHNPKIKAKNGEFYRISLLPQDFAENTEEVVKLLILINDDIFIKLDTLQQEIVVQKIWAKIYFDDEKNVIKKVKEDSVEFSLIIKKYTMDRLEALKLSVSQIVEKMKEDGIKV